MTKTAKLLIAAIALAASALASAADLGPRKEAVFEGKYLQIVASAPAFANAATGLLNEPFTAKDSKCAQDAKGKLAECFVNFIAPLAENRTVATYNARLIESVDGKTQAWDAKKMAYSLLERAGVDNGTVVQIEAPQIAVQNATVVAYRAEGFAFGKKMDKTVMYVIGVALNNGKASYALSGDIATSADLLDANPSKFDKRANRALADFLINTKVVQK